MKSRERSIKDISMSCSFFFSSFFLVLFLTSTSSQVEEDRQTDIRHRYYKKDQFQSPTSLLFKSNNKNLFSQNAHSMVALLVAIAVVFVSSFFLSVLTDLDLNLHLSPSPPLPLIHVHTNKIHILITSLSFSFSLLSDCSGQCSHGFTALKEHGRRRVF